MVGFEDPIESRLMFVGGNGVLFAWSVCKCIGDK